MRLKNSITAICWVSVFVFTMTSSVFATQTHQGEGEVVVIDVKGKKVKLDHGPIKSIGWGGMKMFFDVEDADMLEDIKVGNQVEFEFVKTKDGKFVITDLEPK